MLQTSNRFVADRVQLVALAVHFIETPFTNPKDSIVENFFFSPEPIIWIQEFFGYGHNGIFKIFSIFGETWGVLLVIGLAFWIWGREAAYAALAAVALSVIVKEGMNIFVSVPRPSAEGIVKYQDLETPSFPSGHVVTAVAAWTFITMRHHLSYLWPALVAVLVSLGRLYLGSHYLIDVVVGTIVGVLIGWMLNRWWPPIWQQLSRPSFTVYAWVAGIATVVLAVNLWMNAGIPHRWSVTGTGLGLIAGLVGQSRLRLDTGTWQVVVIGLAGLVAAALAAQWITSLWLHFAVGAVAALWVTMTPALAQQMSTT